jgi:3-hydroxyisobutyrate dehydrogenase-like beta-hydroxyacid dehydrogenase
MARRIGFVGLGNMGQLMARRLLEAGHEVWLHNRTPGKAAPLLAQGGRWAADPQSLAQQVELVITMVADDAALRQVALGTDGVLGRAQPGLTYVDMSTVSGEASAEVAAAATNADVAYLRAPVTGSTALAAAGELGILVSGPRESLDKFGDVFDVLGRQVFHLGTAEEARVMKLALNMLVAGTVVGLAEALVLGERAGLDWRSMLDVFTESAVGSPLVRYKAASLSTRDFAPAFSTAMMAKDLDLALDLGHRIGAALPTTAQSRELLQVTCGLGWGERDFSAAVLTFERLSGAQSED